SPAAGDENVLPAVQLIRNGSISDMPDPRMPQCRAVAGAQREDVACGIPGERQSGIRAQNPRASPSSTEVVGPAGCSGLIVNRFQHCFSEDAVVRARPAILAVFRL